MGYELYLPTRALTTGTPPILPLVAILVCSTLRVRPIPFPHCRVCGIFVSTAHRPLALLSAYIRHTDAAGLDALTSMVTLARRSTPLLLIGADANGHSPWWGPPTHLPTMLALALRSSS